jgi:hypothetical protein
MPSFTPGPGTARTPFGRNQYLRSTKGIKTESYTLAKNSVPAQTIDGTSQKILQPGTVMAKITSGGDAGKIGPYSTDTVGVTDGRSSTANIVGLLDTFAPWQLLEHDMDVAVVYECTAMQGWCFEYTAAGAAVPQPLSNTTATFLSGANKGLRIMFK